MAEQVYVNGALRQRWDDTARTYTEWDAEGVQTLTRPYTAQENAAADAATAAALAEANRVAIDAALDAALASLQVIIDDTNSNINANPAQRIKDMARVQRRLIRHVLARYDGTA